MNMSSFAVPVAGDVTEATEWALRVVAVDPGDTGGAEADTPAVTTVAAAAANTLLLAANVILECAVVNGRGDMVPAAFFLPDGFGAVINLVNVNEAQEPRHKARKETYA